MDHERVGPPALAVFSTVGAALVDINASAMAGGISLVGLAGVSVYWRFVQGRTDTNKAAELAKIEIYKQSEAAKLIVFKDAEAARIEVHRQQEDARKDSITLQLKAIQRSADETNARLEDARKHNETLKELLEATKGRLEDANAKLHKQESLMQAEVFARNDAEAEVKELRKQLDRAIAQVEANSRQLKINERKIDQTGNAHAEAINTNAESIQKVASRLDPPVEVPETHVAPSSDDIDIPPRGPDHGRPDAGSLG